MLSDIIYYAYYTIFYYFFYYIYNLLDYTVIIYIVILYILYGFGQRNDIWQAFPVYNSKDKFKGKTSPFNTFSIIYYT